MSISPGTYNFALQRRADWSVLLQFKDSNDAAIKAWLQANPQVLDGWLDGVTTRDGGDGLAAVKARL